ncbi:MAG: PBSX family phage terminase large subunit, partial [Candidatus Dadabacteria bacterium]|nr:PBSX family phage terminase large subunit [Candidatus Dadabacteria bacterium]
MTNETLIHKRFKPLFRSKKRYFLLTGGRASLKSSTVHQFVAMLSYIEGHGILFTRYTMTSAEKSIIPEFKIVLDRLDMTQDFHITKNVITNKKTG